MARPNRRVDLDDETVVVPEQILEVEIYNDGQIAQWDADDSLEDDERDRIADAITRRQ